MREFVPQGKPDCHSLDFRAIWGGINYSWGVLQLTLVQDKLSSASTLSFIGGLSSARISAFATHNSNLVRRFGVRNCALTGSVLVGFAQIFSGWTTKNLGGMFVCSGFMMGIGMSILFMVSFSNDHPSLNFLNHIALIGWINSASAILQASARTGNRDRILGLRYRWSGNEYHYRSPHPAFRHRMGISNHRHHCIGSDVSRLVDAEGESPTEEGVIFRMVGD